MSGDLFPGGRMARPYLIDEADRRCSHPGCRKSASFFQTATPLATVFGRPHAWVAKWCGEHCPDDWFPGRRAKAAAAPSAKAATADPLAAAPIQRPQGDRRDGQGPRQQTLF